MAKEKPKKFRLNLEFPPEVEQRLQDLKARSESTTITEVFRKSLALFNLYLNQTQAGRTMIIRDPNGSEKQLEIL